MHVTIIPMLVLPVLASHIVLIRILGISSPKTNSKYTEYFIQKIKEEQEHADSNIKSGDLMSAMAHKLTADWYSSMLIITKH
jgi:quinol-cytochrome oxidoreductase complex cytochrome b subunit